MQFSLSALLFPEVNEGSEDQLLISPKLIFCILTESVIDLSLLIEPKNQFSSSSSSSGGILHLHSFTQSVCTDNFMSIAVSLVKLLFSYSSVSSFFCPVAFPLNSLGRFVLPLSGQFLSLPSPLDSYKLGSIYLGCSHSI